MAKKISETKCTCKACGNIWHYGKKEVTDNTMAALDQVTNAALCCTGCFPAAFLKGKEVKDLNKCPKCGSRAVTKETVEHEV